MNKWLKTLVIALAVIIVILLGILIFVPSAKGPTVESGAGGASTAHLPSGGRR